MPTYTSRCSKCETLHDFIRKVDDRDETPKCCKKKTTRILVAPMVSAMAFTGHKGFHLPGGKWIESGTDYKRHMKQNNMVSFAEGQQEATRVQADRKSAEAKDLKNDVIETVKQIKSKST